MEFGIAEPDGGTEPESKSVNAEGLATFRVGDKTVCAGII
jgi:hypothetical protein